MASKLTGFSVAFSHSVLATMEAGRQKKREEQRAFLASLLGEVQRDRVPWPEIVNAGEEDLVNGVPDEILALIFSKIRDAATLLDTLPLVCKRWCKVARQAASWAGAELEFVDAACLANTARILLHAPAAKSLVVKQSALSKFTRRQRHPSGGRKHKAYLEGSRRLRSALRRTRVVTARFQCLRDGFKAVRTQDSWLTCAHVSAVEASTIVASFLQRQQGLLELEVLLDRGSESLILPAVAALGRLKSLQLVVAAGVQYNGELAGKLPALRELNVHADYFYDGASGLPQGLLGDLVRGAPALRVLHVDMPQGGDRAACAELRCLEEVDLTAYRVPRRRDGMDQDAARAVREAFQLCLQVNNPALRSAVVALCLHSAGGWSPRDRIVAEFSSKMPQVELEVVLNCNERDDCETVFGVDCDACGTDPILYSDDSLSSEDDYPLVANMDRPFKKRSYEDYLLGSHSKSDSDSWMDVDESSDVNEDDEEEVEEEEDEEGDDVEEEVDHDDNEGEVGDNDESEVRENNQEKEIQ